VAHGAFSQPGPWRPAVVARLARTLGSAIKVCITPAESAPIGVDSTATRVRNPGVAFCLTVKLKAQRPPTTLNDLVAYKAAVNTGQSKATRSQPAAAREFRHRASGNQIATRMNDREAWFMSSRHASRKSRSHEPNVMHQAARRGAPCKVHGVSRRRGVPRLLLP
jgi:hypothetical protein